MFPLLIRILISSVVLCGAAWADGQTSSLPNPAVDTPVAKVASQQSAVFAGGCFWGVQAVFQHVKGVISATSGYAGGSADTAKYALVSDGNTGHAESVKVVYDPSRISYGQLLKIFFAVANDPTQLNRQGPDSGTQYRSEIFTTNAEQQKVAASYISQLGAARVYPQKIVTRISTLPAFYPAEDYHQNFAELHPYNPYIYVNDRPKVEHLKEQFSGLYR
ncbi:MAG: peptide-methionine (S)-S-oxide reductase MsrA [Nitrosomonadales bacterium]|nr:peptide-methionine (S)-S-oxide reductase MsrA [Nitrosomonadales bacterium]